MKATISSIIQFFKLFPGERANTFQNKIFEHIGR